MSIVKAWFLVCPKYFKQKIVHIAKMLDYYGLYVRIFRYLPEILLPKPPNSEYYCQIIRF